MLPQLVLAGRLDDVITIFGEMPKVARIMAAEPASQALDLAHNIRAHAIILDSEKLDMPLTEFLAALRSKPHTAEIPAVILTSRQLVFQFHGYRTDLDYTVCRSQGRDFLMAFLRQFAGELTQKKRLPPNET